MLVKSNDIGSANKMMISSLMKYMKGTSKIIYMNTEFFQKAVKIQEKKLIERLFEVVLYMYKMIIVL